MIAEHEIECTTASHGDSLRASIVIFGDDSIGHFIMRADEVGGRCAEIGCHHRFDALSVAVGVIQNKTVIMVIQPTMLMGWVGIDCQRLR